MCRASRSGRVLLLPLLIKQPYGFRYRIARPSRHAARRHRKVKALNRAKRRTWSEPDRDPSAIGHSPLIWQIWDDDNFVSPREEARREIVRASCQVLASGLYRIS